MLISLYLCTRAHTADNLPSKNLLIPNSYFFFFNFLYKYIKDAYFRSFWQLANDKNEHYSSARNQTSKYNWHSCRKYSHDKYLLVTLTILRVTHPKDIQLRAKVWINERRKGRHISRVKAHAFICVSHQPHL